MQGNGLTLPSSSGPSRRVPAEQVDPLAGGAATVSADRPFDVVCFSQHRWESNPLRSQQLMSRCATRRRVFFIEEPVYDDTGAAGWRVERKNGRVLVAVPHLPSRFDTETAELTLRILLEALLSEWSVVDPVLWYSTPLAIRYTRELRARAVAYDCVAPLAPEAPGALAAAAELELLGRADVVFASSSSLRDAKQALHPRVHLFPSPVDYYHFGLAQTLGPTSDPLPQAVLPRPRFGYLGRVDARLDFQLLASIAERRAYWQIILVGPVAVMDPASLPRAQNLHYLGPQPYASLPFFLSGWDAGLVPFALNDHTRLLSSGKSAAYLSAGCPVLSTPLPDTVYRYGRTAAVRIAASAATFIE